MDEDSEQAFERFVAAEAGALLRFAYLLTGSREAAEDLLQSALEQCYRHWRRVQRVDQPDRYVRRILANAAVDRWRYRRRRPEARLTEAGQRPAADPAVAVLDRDELIRALRTLSPRQRAVVVLRYVEDRSEIETAALLDCSTGSLEERKKLGRDGPGSMDGRRSSDGWVECERRAAVVGDEVGLACGW